MRTLILGSLVISAAAAFAADPAQPAAPAAAPAPAPVVAPVPPPTPAKLTPEQEKQAFMVQGYFMARQFQLSSMVKELRMDDAEVAALVQGMAFAAKGEELPFKYESIVAGANVFFNDRAAAGQKEWTDANAAFLAKVDTDTAVTKTASGLRYQVLVPGTAEKPTATSKVSVRYTGKLCDGKVFDTTDKNGGQPIELSLAGVVKGWTEGLQLVGKGGKIHLWVPAALGYGEQGGGPLPAGSVLDFEVELVDFK